MNTLLDLALQNASAKRLVICGNLQDMRGIDPVVRTPAHDMVAHTRRELVDRNIRVRGGIHLRLILRHAAMREGICL